MLVLTRRLGERIVIANNIVIEVVGVQGGRVRLGIQAPSDIPVVRQELLTNRGQATAGNTAPAHANIG
jgi:carbon storage regulator